MDKLLYREEVYAIVGAAIEVHRELGNGFLEPVYQESLQLELASRSIDFDPKRKLELFYKNQLLEKEYIPDFVCDDKIIVEIKALSQLTSIETAQIINYLKATKLRVGLLINFGSKGRLEWQRYVL
ncbi:MAG: GxxExxY protein [Acidobacteria bacterium]|nr:GxxExxY protein [Acidobacteriota bacterium]MBK8811216.1 GxxExxY protein [Acidobacteriota bacterium]